MKDYSLMQMPCEEIGRALACSGDDSQCSVINSFAKELICVCRDPEFNGMQICSIARGLDRNGKMLVNALAEFISIRAKAEKGTA